METLEKYIFFKKGKISITFKTSPGITCAVSIKAKSISSPISSKKAEVVFPVNNFHLFKNSGK